MDHKGDYIYKRLDSYLIDSVKPYRTFYDEFFDYQRSQFGELYYNENNAEIYRTIRVGKSFFEGDTSVIQEKYASKSVYLIQVFDKLLNLKGEGVIPTYASGVYTPFKNGILIYNKLESFREQSVVLDYYTLEPIKDNIETYREQVRSEVMALNKPLWSGSYKKYLEKVFPNNVFKEVFVFNNEITTPSAKEFWKEYFKENLDRFENDSIAIIFISSSKQRTMRDLNINKAYKNVFIDDQFIYNDFIGPVVHCQYINLRTENFDIEICDAPHTYIISRKLDFYLKNKKTHRKNKSKIEFK